MPTKQGAQRAPQIPRKVQLLCLITSLLAQTGKKKSKEGKIEKIDPIPGGNVFIKLMNASLAKVGAIKKKAVDDFLVTPENAGEKLSSLNNWYVQAYGRLDDGVLPEVPRDHFGNVSRQDLPKTLPEGIVVHEAELDYNLDGLPANLGRRAQVDSLTAEDAMSLDDFDF